MTKRLWSVLALLLSLSLIAAACGDDDDSSSSESESEESAEGGDTEGDDTEGDTEGDDTEGDDTEGDAAAGDGEMMGDTLVIGSILPETGALAFLGSPMINGVPLAVEDILAGGGNVEHIPADSGTDPDAATEAANRLIGEGANVIVGAAASGVSQALLETLLASEIPQCSPSNTAPTFAGQDNAAFYFRTVPGDDVVTPIFADTIIADGHQNVAIAARADEYGEALSALLSEALTESGVTNTVITYNPEETSFDATVEAINAEAPDAVALIAFSEGAQIIRSLIEGGTSPDVLYGSDGLATVNLPAEVNPDDANVVDGMKVIAALGDVTFGERLAERTGGDLLYGAHSYDCTIILTLASEAAGSVAGADIIANVVAVTSGDNECTTYADCHELLAAGESIAYNGPAGAGAIGEKGESPAAVNYSIAEFIDGAPITQDVVSVDLSS
jgi:branched-chain amino acid transport system substrate-binding protein